MTDTTNLAPPVKGEYPIATIKVSETTRDFRGFPDPARVAVAEKKYRADLKYEGNILCHRGWNPDRRRGGPKGGAACW